VVGEAAALLRRYRVDGVSGDRYAGEFVPELFRVHGITYEPAPHDRSGLYLELLPRINARAVVLLDTPDLLRELRGLERRRGGAGRDRVDHRPGEHDDLANAAAGALVAVGEELGRPPLRLLNADRDDESDPDHERDALLAAGALPSGGVRRERQRLDPVIDAGLRRYGSWMPGDD
jgi:hypothetical protein